MFLTVLYFCSMLSWHFSCAMSVKCKECCHSTGLLPKNYLIQNKNCQEVTRCCSMLDCALLSEVPRKKNAQSFFMCNVFGVVLIHYCIMFFLCNVVWSLLDNIAQGFNPRNAVPGVLRQHYTGFFLVHRCLESLGQHCIG